MARILVVEDDKEINRLLCAYLATQGYTVLQAENGLGALEVLRSREDIDLVLLDLMLPLQSGDVVLTKLREFSEVPVIILSAKNTVQTRIDVIRMGADDYITKPFDLDEVEVRIEAVLRRTTKEENSGTQDSIQYKDMVMDCTAKTVTVREKTLVLTGKEYMILELLLRNPTRLFSKANLFESVWNEPFYREDSTLKVHISNLRNKIKQYAGDEEYIETIWGMGYRLKQEKNG
ncbi:MAG: response regulator transcription factor [Bacteroidales bacterium]|nr:response regulator transcription factor [Clostridium sp.]MCM1204585.1 response regulator transcription factor [Bacteroidales bacterium]